MGQDVDDVFAHGRRGLRQQVVGQQLRITLNNRQWGAQVMGGHGQQAGLALLQQVQLQRHLGQFAPQAPQLVVLTDVHFCR